MLLKTRHFLYQKQVLKVRVPDGHQTHYDTTQNALKCLTSCKSIASLCIGASVPPMDIWADMFCFLVICHPCPFPLFSMTFHRCKVIQHFKYLPHFPRCQGQCVPCRPCFPFLSQRKAATAPCNTAHFLLKPLSWDKLVPPLPTKLVM